MIKLFIDGRQADIDSRTDVSISLGVTSVTSPEFGRTGYSKSITIPMTPRNREIMGYCEQINGVDMYNARLHTARIEYEGFTIMEGTVRLTECRGDTEAGAYRFNIIGTGKFWVQHARNNRLSTLFPEYETVINPKRIADSWTGDTPVRFLPVLRDDYEFTTSSVNLDRVDRVTTASDYHPFIHVRSFLRAAFGDAGYSISSEFMESDYFGSLYMSGNFPERNASALKDKMDFRAERFAAVTAQADVTGKIYANPFWAEENTVGNIVDTADPREERDGVTLENVYNNGGCFRMADGRIAFVPLHEVSAAFEYKLNYATDYYIKDSAELIGFGNIYLGYGDERNFKILNRFADRKNEFRANRSYRCFVFSFIQGYRYNLTAKRIVNPAADPENLRPSDYVTETITSFTTRNALVSTPVEGIYTDLNITCGSVNGSTVAYTGDWALYDGYIEERGMVELEVTLRSRAERITPSLPKYFSSIAFSGGEPGMKLTLRSAVVRPVFQPQPTEGSTVGFSDVAAHDISRLDVINALRHMFNLCFYTDNFEKKVYIEPRSEFYRDDTVIDWSDRIDYSEPVTVEELGHDMSKIFSMRYKSGDGAVSRHNVSEGGRIGEWSASIRNVHASDSVSVHENPLFRPSLNTKDCLPSAPSSSWLQAGDRGGKGDIYVEDLNFPPKIVRYMGLVPLPEGERWSWPSYKTEYPLLAFHHEGSGTGDGFTLCFEDRDGQKGLHRYWDGNIKAYNMGRRLTLWLRLGAGDIEPIIFPNRLKRDFRALYRLRIDGEFSYWRLEEICDYNPRSVSTRCVFIKEY